MMMKPKKKTTTEIICENLGLPNQTIFQDYKCTLKSNFSFFGRLYIGEDHLMFVSNMFGIVKKTAIIIDTISRVTEISNDTISITGRCFKEPKNQDQELVFYGFKNANAVKIINALWKKEKLSSEVLNSNNEEEAENGQKISEMKNLDESSMEVSIFNPEIVETQKQKMVELVLPCSLDQFYRFFLADDAEVYPRTTKIVTNPWKRNEEMNAQIREITALLKVKGVPFKSEAGMSQVWMITKRTPQQLNVKAITQMSDVPYSSYFTCEEHMTILKEGETKCKFICSTAIVINKATYMKNTILTRTFQDLKEDYVQWTQNVKDLLDKMKKNYQQSQKKKSKQGTINNIGVQFQNQTTQSLTQIPQESAKQLKLSTQLQNKIDRLDFKISQLIKVVILLLIIAVANTLINIYSLRASPSHLHPTLHPQSQM